MAEVPLPTPTDNAVPSTDIRDAVYAGAMLDKVVTSTELTYTDRLGGEHYTVDGIKAEGDKVVEETRQNLIPLSRQYMTLADAQADIANIPSGSTTYVRSQDGSTLADEYINVSGTLQPTGRRMLRDDYGYQVSPDSVALAGYDPETKRVAPFLNTDGRLIQIGPDGKYYELLTPQEAELYALGSEGQVTQFIGGEKVWRMIVDAAPNKTLRVTRLADITGSIPIAAWFWLTRRVGEVATMMPTSSLSMDFICQGLRYIHTQKMYRSVSFL